MIVAYARKLPCNQLAKPHEAVRKPERAMKRNEETRMELVNVLSQIPLPVIAVALLILAIITNCFSLPVCKDAGAGWNPPDVYQLILKAEHIYNESGQGKQKLKYVVSQARGLLPKWLQIFVTEEAMMKVIDKWFEGVKDLLDDGRVNGSQK